MTGKPAQPEALKKQKVEASRIGELGEYKINIQLDQLPKNTKHLSDLLIRKTRSRTGYSQIDHVVLSPYGLFVIETKNYTGEIKGKKEDTYWRVSNRFNLYNPLKQNYGHIKAIEEQLKSFTFPNLTFISMVSFTMRCRFSIDPQLRMIESNELVVYDTELSEFIQRKINRIRAMSNQPLLTDEDILAQYEILQKANITNPEIRQQHIAKIKRNW
ncbi:nuclease-related domain-containing protein [Cohnella lubricantis]